MPVLLIAIVELCSGCTLWNFNILLFNLNILPSVLPTLAANNQVYHVNDIYRIDTIVIERKRARNWKGRKNKQTNNTPIIPKKKAKRKWSTSLYSALLFCKRFLVYRQSKVSFFPHKLHSIAILRIEKFWVVPIYDCFLQIFSFSLLLFACIRFHSIIPIVFGVYF